MVTHVVGEGRRNVPGVPSPLHVKDRLYTVRDSGVLACMNVCDGETLYRTRIPDATGQYSVSPILMGNPNIRVSCLGVISVIEPGDDFHLVDQFGTTDPSSPARRSMTTRCISGPSNT